MALCRGLFCVGAVGRKHISLTEKAMRRMRAPAELRMINHVTSPLFKEPGTLEQVAHESAEWLVEQLRQGEL